MSHFFLSFFFSLSLSLFFFISCEHAKSIWIAREQQNKHLLTWQMLRMTALSSNLKNRSCRFWSRHFSIIHSVKSVCFHVAARWLLFAVLSSPARQREHQQENNNPVSDARLKTVLSWSLQSDVQWLWCVHWSHTVSTKAAGRVISC